MPGEIRLDGFGPCRRFGPPAASLEERRAQSFRSTQSRDAAALSRSDGKVGDQRGDAKTPCAKCARATERSIADLIQRCADDGCAIHRAALVVGSLIDPESIANPHIRAHALEGRLFRTVLEDALRSRGIQCAIFTEREVYPRASNLLGQSPVQLRKAIAELGHFVSGPWRADQKVAALAAWTSLGP